MTVDIPWIAEKVKLEQIIYEKFTHYDRDRIEICISSLKKATETKAPLIFVAFYNKNICNRPFNFELAVATLISWFLSNDFHINALTFSFIWEIETKRNKTIASINKQ